MQTPAVLVLGGFGYVGSALVTHLKRVGMFVRAVDLGKRGNPGAIAGEEKAYQALSKAELNRFDTVVLLAGHSNVGDCDRWPQEAFANNVSGFVDLVHKLDGQKLIFASSISVYVDTFGRLASEDDKLPEAVCVYDLHKQMIERYAALANRNYFALRFGTVCGPSPNLRTDVLLNSLVWSAMRKGHLEVANRQVHRPLLGIFDLCRAVETIVTESPPPGPYNLASTNVRIGDLVDGLASRLQVPCIEVERATKYDIQVMTDKFCRMSGFEFEDSVESLTDALEDSIASNRAPVSLCHVL
jgi:nucleoside-diphosphate-sugar epimerase